MFVLHMMSQICTIFGIYEPKMIFKNEKKGLKIRVNNISHDNERKQRFSFSFQYSILCVCV